MSIQILVICAAILLTIVGVWMRGSIHGYRSDMEEAAKDQLMTTEAANKKIRRYSRVSAFCVASGIALMVFAMLFLGV